MARIFDYANEAQAERSYIFHRSLKSNEEKLRWLATQPGIVQWFRKHPQYAEDSAQTVSFYIYDFIDYLRVDDGSPLKGCDTFEEMLTRIEDLKAREQNKISQYLFNWVNLMKVTRNSKSTYYNKIRSLFKYNIHSMVFPENERLPWTEDTSDLRQHNEFGKQHLVKILSAVNDPMWRSVFLAKHQAMFGEVELIQFNEIGWSLIKDQYAKGESVNHRKDCAVFIMPPRPKIKGRGALPYVTSFEADAMKALKHYIESVRGIPKEGEPIWTTTKGNPISTRGMREAWNRYARLSGVVKPYTPTCPQCGGNLRLKKPLLEDGRRPHYWHCRSCKKSYKRSELDREPTQRELSRIRYDFGLHEMSRDIPASELQIAAYRTGTPQWVANLRMGDTSKVDSNGYQRSMQKDHRFAEEIFSKLAPWLNVLSETPDKVDLAEVESIKKRLVEVESNREAELQRVRNEVRAEMRGFLEDFKAAYGLDRVDPTKPKELRVQVKNDGSLFIGATNFNSGDEAKDEVDKLVRGLGEKGVEVTTKYEDTSDPKPQKKKRG